MDQTRSGIGRRGGNVGTHGHCTRAGRSPTYCSWQNTISRLTCAASKGYAHYQNRGIKVCARWLYGDGIVSSFECFLADMGERPSLKHTLDRIDNDGDYEPGNCRWATRREQANNRTSNKRFEYRGASYTLADLARETGVSKDTLRTRLCRSKQNWTVEGALTVPARHGKGRGC